MAKEVVKKLSVQELKQMVRKAINEALEEAVPPPVPMDARVKSVLAKREKGEQLSSDEKRTYLDFLGKEMEMARGVAKSNMEKSSVGQAMNAMEKNPERLMARESKKLVSKK